LENNNDTLKSKIEFAFKFTGVISILTYFFGFLFTQGLTVAFNTTDAFYSWLSKGFLGLTPFSHQLYFLNGIFILGIFILSTCFTYVIWRYAFCNVIIGIKKLKHKFIPNKNFSGIHKFYSDNICYFLPLIIIGIAMIILVNVLNNDKCMYVFRILYIIAFSNSIFELIRINSQLPLSNIITENNLYISIKNLFNLKDKIICFVIITIFLSLFSYTYGIVSICKYMYDVQNKDNSFKAARIITNDNHQNTYFYLDNNNDFFIGYSWNPNSLVMIPKSSIKDINVYALNVSDDKEKYIKTNDNKYNSFSKDLVKTINNYYLYRIEKPDPNKYLNLLSHDYIKENLSNISPDILGKLWEKDKIYNDKNINDFIGIDLSLPEYDKNLSTKKDKIYSIYVIEY
jgi:hypothetical protein